jgi:hypothetical protein
MSLLELIKLIGFATAAALHLYMCWLLLRAGGHSRCRARLLWLAFSIGIWHFGNFLAPSHPSCSRWTGSWLKAANTIAFVALAFQPPLLIHAAHLKLWDWLDPKPRGGASGRLSELR